MEYQKIHVSSDQNVQTSRKWKCLDFVLNLFYPCKPRRDYVNMLCVVYANLLPLKRHWVRRLVRKRERKTYFCQPTRLVIDMLTNYQLLLLWWIMSLWELWMPSNFCATYISTVCRVLPRLIEFQWTSTHSISFLLFKISLCDSSAALKTQNRKVVSSQHRWMCAAVRTCIASAAWNQQGTCIYISKD